MWFHYALFLFGVFLQTRFFEKTKLSAKTKTFLHIGTSLIQERGELLKILEI